MPTAGRCPTAAASIISPRRDRLSPETVGRFPAGAGDRAARTGVAGGGLRPVPPVRHRQAAADPLFRAPLSRRLRRHVRRHPRGSLHADGAGGDQAAVLLMRQLAARIGKRLKASRAMLVTAESCTGGWVAQAVTAGAGSARLFERGFVTYSNRSQPGPP